MLTLIDPHLLTDYVKNALTLNTQQTTQSFFWSQRASVMLDSLVYFYFLIHPNKPKSLIDIHWLTSLQLTTLLNHLDHLYFYQPKTYQTIAPVHLKTILSIPGLQRPTPPQESSSTHHPEFKPQHYKTPIDLIVAKENFGYLLILLLPPLQMLAKEIAKTKSQSQLLNAIIDQSAFDKPYKPTTL